MYMKPKSVERLCYKRPIQCLASSKILTAHTLTPWRVWGQNQWGRRLEGWPNTAAHLAGWRRVTWQVGFCTWTTGHTLCLSRTVQVALTGADQLQGYDGISSCCSIENVHHPSWAASRKVVMAWYSSRPLRSLWSELALMGRPPNKMDREDSSGQSQLFNI